MMGIGLLVLLLVAAAASSSSKGVPKLDANVPDQNARAFNKALAEERDTRELRSFASAAVASGAPNYARAFIRKFLLLEGVPEPQVDAEVERYMTNPTLISRPPPSRGPAPGPTETPAPAPGNQLPPPPPPGLSAAEAQALLGAVQSVLQTRNPQSMRLLASQLRQPGDAGTQAQRNAAADALEQAATQLERASIQPPAQTSPGLPTAPAPGAQPPPGPAPQGMPDALRQMFDRAMQSGGVQGLGTAARVLEDAGFPQEAAVLRQRAGEIAARTPPPPPEEQPSRTLDPQMPADLAADVAKQLALQGDPKILRELATRVRGLGFGDTADLLDAKAAQLETMIKAGETLQDVGDIIKQEEQATRSPGQPDVHVTPQPGGGVPITPKPKPKPAPAPAPAQPAPQPRPQPLPAEKTPLQIAADNLQRHLLQLIAVHGMPGAKGKEDTFLVSKFQGASGSANPDGKYGPGTALKSANVVSDIAPVFYWNKGANTTTVKNYRNELLRIAREAQAQGNAARAEQLERSAQRERGLGGVAGGPLAA